MRLFHRIKPERVNNRLDLLHAFLLTVGVPGAFYKCEPQPPQALAMKMPATGGEIICQKM
jgi:hypothetical protein